MSWGQSWLYVVILICQSLLVFGINCISQQGTISGPNSGDLSQAQCPAPYSIVSCGFQTIDKNEHESFDGSYIIADICFARNGNNASPTGVQAVARCCQLSQISTFCTTYQSNRSNASDDDAISFTCPITQPLLMGCSVSTDSPWPSIDGAYPFPLYEFYTKSPNILYPTNNICTGGNGSGGKGVYVWATCCSTTDSTVNLQCKTMIGEHSPSLTGSNTYNTGQESIVTCPIHYFMTSCHAFSFYKSQNKWIIDDNDRCIGRAVDWEDLHYNTTTSAICCQVDTIAPSTTPSIMPSHTHSRSTSNPTKSPFEPANFEPVININVTININKSNISIAVINDIKQSVNNYMNGLSTRVNINYTMSVDIIKKKQNMSTVIFLQLYTTDSDREYIDVEQLDEDVTTSLNNNFGNGVTNVVVIEVDKDALYDHETRNTFYQQITGIIAVCFAIVFIIAIVDAKIVRRNDYFKISSLLIGALQTLDCISDIFFIIKIKYHPEFVFILSYSTPVCILFISSIFFIVIPIILTLYQLHYVMNKYWLQNDVLRDWLNQYTYFVYFISLITGSSFSAVQICSSGAFGVRIFSMPLSMNERDSFLYRRIYSVLLMENIPQLALAIWFIIATHSHIDEIIYISMLFSLISISMSLLTLCTAKKIVKTQDHCHISLNITGNMFDVQKIKFCRQNTKDIKSSLSVLLGLERSMIEILRPEPISSGLKITILLYISIEKYEELKVKDIIYEKHKKGAFATIFNDSWNLSSLPDIDNIICQQIASKQRAKMSYKLHQNKEQIRQQMATHEMVNLSKNKNATNLIMI